MGLPPSDSGSDHDRCMEVDVVSDITGVPGASGTSTKKKGAGHGQVFVAKWTF